MIESAESAAISKDIVKGFPRFEDLPVAYFENSINVSYSELCGRIPSFKGSGINSGGEELASTVSRSDSFVEFRLYRTICDCLVYVMSIPVRRHTKPVRTEEKRGVPSHFSVSKCTRGLEGSRQGSRCSSWTVKTGTKRCDKLEFSKYHPKCP